MKVKCHHCSETATDINSTGKWTCTQHKNEGGSAPNIVEIAKELQKYISIGDIIEAREKFNSINIEKTVNEVEAKAQSINKDIARFDSCIQQVQKLLQEQQQKIIPEQIVIKLHDKFISSEGKHENFAPLLQLVANKVDCFLHGPAGAGKNTAVEQVAKELNSPFYCLQLSQLSLKSELTGYKNIVNDNFMPTSFTTAYENGGIFFADELDNWAPTVLTSVNMAIANGFYQFPNGLIRRHPDFVFVAAGNTAGLGAESHYVTSRALSGASRDRLVFLQWPIDEKLEAQLVPEEYSFYVSFVQKCRTLSVYNGDTILITPRATMQGAKMLAIGWSRKQVADSIVLRGVPVPSFLLTVYKEFIDG